MLSSAKYCPQLGDLFDDVATKVMGEAFDAACALAGNVGDRKRETMAVRIIAAATHGERDLIRLRDAGLGGMSMPLLMPR